MSALNNSGDYTSPLVRKTFVSIPIVTNGTQSVTGRFRAQNLTGGTFSGDKVFATLHNTGNASITVEFQETDDRRTGVRTTVGTPVTLVPGAQDTQTLQLTKEFLEVKGTSGESYLRLQLESRIRWDDLGFAKDDPFYPTKLWKANVPSYSSLI